MPDSHYQRAYWQRNLWLTASLLIIWFLLTFVTAYYADTLNAFVFMGFPLGFYLFSQGNPILYLLIIGIHVVAMERLERRYAVNEHRATSAP